jgi:hypothetical protein
VSEYNAIKSAVSSLARKAQGSLVVRDLSSDVRADQVRTCLCLCVPGWYMDFTYSYSCGAGGAPRSWKPWRSTVRVRIAVVM